MYKVGVVGPKRSVDKIIQYIQHLEQDIQFIGFPYNTANETIDILENNHHGADFWLFSGNIPYVIAKQSRHFSTERMQFIHISINSFYRGILELSHQLGKFAKRVSIDTLDLLEPDYQDKIEELKGLLDELYIKRFHPETSITEIIDYHLELWERNQIDIVITAYPVVEEALNKRGIPVYGVGPMEQDIYYTFQLLSEKIRTFYYKETQTTALTIQFKNFNAIKNRYENGYGIHFLRLKVLKIILQICEIIDGYFVEEQNARFLLFSSRGIVEQNINTIYELIHRLEVEAEELAYVGIGHATTVYYAERFASKALEQALEQDFKGIIIMGEDGTVTEYQHNSSQLTYTSRIENMEIVKKLESASISPKMFSKLEAKMNELKLESFSSKIIAKELEMTERNAQRILSELLAAGLIEYCGSEKRNTRGRSIKLYKFVDIN